MLSKERIERYRRMTPEERWREVEELMTLAWRSLLELPVGEAAANTLDATTIIEIERVLARVLEHHG